MSDTNGDNVVHLDLVANVIENAKPAPQIEEAARGGRARRGKAETDGGVRDPNAGGGGGLPAECPVTALGRQGNVYHYLDDGRQYRDLAGGKHTRLEVQSLFGRHYQFLYDTWPRKKKIDDGDGGETWITTGWMPEKAAEALMAACAAAGVWSAAERVRGPGAWKGAEGELILHCGDEIWLGRKAARTLHDGAWRAPGLVGRYVYPAGEAVARPSPDPSPPRIAEALLDVLRTWRWRGGEMDALLLLGWIGAAMVGGALKWRPAAWVTGGKGTGKSTLKDLIKLVLDAPAGLKAVDDASGPGVWQKLGHATVPVLLDELEAEDDNRRQQTLIKLIRLAASGGLIVRGGADHKSEEFTARSCFMALSINVPPLLPQDRSRIAVLELQELDGGDEPRLDEAHYRAAGRGLRRRMVDAWARFPEVLATYRKALSEIGHTSRGADQYGTLLACAEVLLNDKPLAIEGVRALVDRLAVDILERWDESDQAQMLQHLVSFGVAPYPSAGQQLIGDWIRKAAGKDGPDIDDVAANRTLSMFGCKVVWIGRQGYLAVANKHNALTKIFAGTHWAGKAGATSGWVTPAQRLPGALWGEKTGLPQPVWFGAVPSRATFVPLALVLPPDGAEDVGAAPGRLQFSRRADQG